jgi:hypothetical protein
MPRPCLCQFVLCLSNLTPLANLHHLLTYIPSF